MPSYCARIASSAWRDGQVEVVGRLVQHEEVGPLQGQLRQRDPAALAAAQRANGLENVVATEEKAPQVRPRALLAQMAGVAYLVQHEPLRIQVVVRLRVVADLHVVAQRGAPGERRDLADQRAQKRRLAAAVRADQADALAALHQHIAHPHAQSRAAAILVADSQRIGCQRDLAGLDLRAHAELERRVHRRAFDALQAVELLLAATRLFAALPRLVAADELLGVRDVFLLRLVLARPALHPLGAQLHVARVGAGIQLGALVGDLDGARGDTVEEVAVVRDDDERARPVEQIVLQPLQRGEVEVVRRLVEQQQIRLLQQQLAERGARLLAAAEVRRRSRLLLAREAEAIQHLAHARLQRVAARVLEALL